jgi:N-methylhydantoinase B/oxoprolinase/acetone carboxylase alpha subunit
LPDITAIAPVFVAGRRRFSPPTGPIIPTSRDVTREQPLATEIFQEGLILPPLKLVRRGRINDDVLRLILANAARPRTAGRSSRPDRCLRKGPLRILEAVEKYGLKRVERYADAIQDYTETICGKPPGDARGNLCLQRPSGQ